MRYNLKRNALAATLLGAFIMLSTNSTKAQDRPNLSGVDHIGINVPDLPQAVRFFTDVLGFSPVTQIGPVPLDSAWKKANRMHMGTGPVTIKMTRAGYGANIELFNYEKNEGSTQQPGSDDIGATHIAFYTADINGSIAFMRSKGVTFLGAPFTMPVGDTEGETFVYFLTPWGSKMELVSYPDGKGYEKHHPAIKLWSPKDVAGVPVASDTLTKTQQQQLANAQLQLWNEKDKASRLSAFAKLYATDILFVDRSKVATDINGVNAFVEALQQQHPAFRFSLVKVDANHNTVRVFWNYGDSAHPALVKGMDLIFVENGKIKSLYAFADVAGK